MMKGTFLQLKTVAETQQQFIWPSKGLLQEQREEKKISFSIRL